MLDDFSHDTQEDDLTHLPEILQLHDLSMDPPAGMRNNFAGDRSTISQIVVFTTTSSMRVIVEIYYPKSE